MDYNQDTMLRKFYLICFLTIILFSQSAFRSQVMNAAPSPYDLIAEVNSYRVSMGLYALNPDAQVMSAAQGHADWIVATGNGGHTGASGSDETMRVYWSGYGGGKSIKCDEAWASTTSVSSAVYEAWSDWTHQQVMLNGWGNNYTDVGAGVADNGDGTYVFILDVCLVEGGSAPNYTPNNSVDPNATPDMSNYIFGVSAATPAPDGSIVHIVKFGQTLATISEAYKITVDELRSLNGMAPDNTTIWPDQKLLIKKPEGTPSAVTTVTVSGTPGIESTLHGTNTMAPTFTPRSKTTTPLPSQALNNIAITSTPEKESITGNPPKQTIGMVLITLCGLGLIGLVYSFLKK
jgi:LysM repeat protein